MQRTDGGFLSNLVEDAKARVKNGFYKVSSPHQGRGLSLREALRRSGRVPVVAEVKFRSPANGVLGDKKEASTLARAYERGGAAAISVLTDPDNFGGRLEYLSAVLREVSVPVMMKDVIVEVEQVRAASLLGADAVLLISRVYADGYVATGLEEMVKSVHRLGMEAVVEVFDGAEYEVAMSGEADVVGINNRDLDTLKVSLDVSKRILSPGPHQKPVICESGISTREDMDYLRGLGADGFLVGSALMASADPEAALKKMTSI